jgi:hypothetical protein
MPEDLLSTFAILCIEGKMVDLLINFNEKVTEAFVAQKERRKDISLKEVKQFCMCVYNMKLLFKSSY